MKAVERLKELGWKQVDETTWKTDENRYVRLDLPYIDFYVYAYGKKYKSWLTTEELKVFMKLIKESKR